MNAIPEVITPILSSPFGETVVLGILLWTFFWKGLALWYAARGGNKYWFVVILLLNTMGIVEIMFLVLKRLKIVKPAGKESISSQIAPSKKHTRSV